MDIYTALFWLVMGFLALGWVEWETRRIKKGRNK
jgi:hypothetical protein